MSLFVDSNWLNIFAERCARKPSGGLTIYAYTIQEEQNA